MPSKKLKLSCEYQKISQFLKFKVSAKKKIFILFFFINKIIYCEILLSMSKLYVCRCSSPVNFINKWTIQFVYNGDDVWCDLMIKFKRRLMVDGGVYSILGRRWRHPRYLTPTRIPSGITQTSAQLFSVGLSLSSVGLSLEHVVDRQSGIKDRICIMAHN